MSAALDGLILSDEPYIPEVVPRGNPDAKILIVGEAPGANEVAAGKPFVGASGIELEKMLAEAGISVADCRFTNVVNVRPPNNRINLFFRSSKKKATDDGAHQRYGKYAMPIIFDGIRELKAEIDRVKPNLVIALGNPALWALTGEWGITKWRGSETIALPEFNSVKVIPTYHPAAILRRWDWRWVSVQDFRRCKREMEFPHVNTPPFVFTLRPNYSTVVVYLDSLARQLASAPTKLAVDIETRAGHIACLGIATSRLDATCIPFMCVEDPEGYWSQAEEAEIIYRLRTILTHKNARVIGQNFLYDNQYLARHWGFRVDPMKLQDTMMKQHVAYPGVPKGLDFISSIYCDYHCYWKDEGKEWQKGMDEDILWQYNCKDCVATYEADEALDDVLDSYDLWPQYNERMLTSRTAFRMMLRGVNTDLTAKAQLSKELMEALLQYQDWLTYVLNGFNLFGAKGGVSPQKMMKLCYDIFQLPPKRTKNDDGTYRLTADKNAVKEWLTSCEPIYRPILQAIVDYRSMTVFKSTFADARLDHDRRFRCQMNVAGPHTFRWSTSEDAFGFGTNTQNIPKGDER